MLHGLSHHGIVSHQARREFLCVQEEAEADRLSPVGRSSRRRQRNRHRQDQGGPISSAARRCRPETGLPEVRVTPSRGAARPARLSRSAVAGLSWSRAAATAVRKRSIPRRLNASGSLSANSGRIHSVVVLPSFTASSKRPDTTRSRGYSRRSYSADSVNGDDPTSID